MPDRLILIDGNAILHRAYHALPPLTTRSGELVNAVYGFASMLLKILEELKPNYLAVAFDTGKPTFRQQEFIGYQAKRPRMDDELVGQTEKVRSLVEAFGFPIFMAEGYEADDVIGTLVKKAEKFPKLEVVIVTGDRDLMQLVGERVKLYMPRKGISEGEIVDEKGVIEKMGIPPKKIVDYKSLVGDSSDNYPGVSGIGPKTAVRILQIFTSLEELYENLEKVKEIREIGGEKTYEKLREGKESAFVSKRLATILDNVPLDLNLEDCRVKGFDETKVLELLGQLGFRSLIARIKGEVSAKEKKEKKDDLQQSLF